MANQTQGLQVQLSLSGLASVEAGMKQLQGFIVNIASVAKAATIALAAVAGIKGLADKTTEVIQLGHQLENLKAKAGATIPELMAMQRLLKQGGESADEASTLFKKMQKSIVDAAEEGGPAAKVFEQLKLDLTTLSGEGAAKQFRDIVETISKIENPAKRTQAALAIFGRSGDAVLAMSRDMNEFRAAFDKPSEFVNVMSRNAELFSKMDVSLQRLASNGKKMMAGVLDQIAPMFEDAFKKIGSIDLTPIGEKIGGFFGVIIQSWRDDKFPEMIGLLIESGFELGVIAAEKLFGLLVSFLTSNTFANLGAALLNAIMTFGVRSAEFLINALQTPITYMAAGWDWLFNQAREKAQRFANWLMGIMPTAINYWAEKLESFINGTIDRLNKISKFFGGGSIGHIDPFKKMYTPQFDVTPAASFASSLELMRRTANDTTRDVIKFLEDSLGKSRIAFKIGNLAGTGSALKKLGDMIDAFVAKRRALGTGSGGEASADFMGIITGAAMKVLKDREEALKTDLETIQGDLATLENDYTKTAAEKYTEREKLLDKEKQKLQDIIDTRNKLAGLLDGVDPTRAQNLREGNRPFEKQKNSVGAKEGLPDPNSWSDQFTAAITRAQDQVGTFAQAFGNAITSAIGGTVSALSNGINGLITGTMKWGQAMNQIRIGILNGIAKAISDMIAQWLVGIALMGIKWVATHVLMKTVSSAFSAFTSALGWKKVGESNAQEAAKAPALATNAASASTGSFGLSAIVGIAAFIAGIGLAVAAATGAFAEGGFTGPGGKYDIAGIVHRGEFVMPAHAVSRIGVDNLEAMRQGNIQQASSTGTRDMQIHAWFNKEDLDNHILNNPNVDHRIVRVAQRHVGKFVRR